MWATPRRGLRLMQGGASIVIAIGEVGAVRFPRPDRRDLLASADRTRFWAERWRAKFGWMAGLPLGVLPLRGATRACRQPGAWMANLTGSARWPAPRQPCCAQSMTFFSQRVRRADLDQADADGAVAARGALE